MLVNILVPVWRTVSENDNYECSVYGEVRRKKNQRPVKSFVHKNTKYRTITLSKDGVLKTYYLHRLIALSHLMNDNHYNEVDHINGNKNNNSIHNLRWVTHQQNIDFYHARKNNPLANVILN